MNWSYSAEDWRFRADADAVRRAEEMVNDVAARDIILFHDERLQTALLLDNLLPAWKERGLGFAPSLERFA
jgi:peptidoglycan/xylan/chitin deacetylase (PgdA/CDA1 family)